ncbi:MAG: GPI anchored serine-threonine rich family protein [Candidatus Aminicenantes bacterium]|nr:GPI anchored serine-threonine rich family protein [Candidatus Aminicenantes bacterium]
MKKAMVFFIFTILSVAAARTQTIKILSPNGGESWPVGLVRAITWQAQGISGNVNIVLRRGGAKVGDIAVNIPASQGTFSWTVGTLLNGTAAPEDGYIVRVKIESAAGLYVDDSDSGFRISRMVAGLQQQIFDLHPVQSDPPVFQGLSRLPDLTIKDFYYKDNMKVFSIQMTNLSPTTYSGYVKIKMETEPGDCPPQEKREYFPRFEKDMIFLYEIFNCDFVGNPCRMHIRVELLPENPEENHNNNVFDGMVPRHRGVNFRVADSPIRLRFSQGSLTETIYQGPLLASAVYLDPGQSRLVSRSLTIPVRQGEFYISISSFHEPNPQCPVAFKFANEFFD